MSGARVVAVLSPKGGTGKTTVSTNLAVGLARRSPGDVVLVDLDLAFGDVAAALLLDARRGIADVHAGVTLEEAVLHHRSGLHVLGAPDDVLPPDGDDAEVVGSVLDALAARYAVVVLDTGAGFDAATRAAVERAHDLVLVASPDVPTLLGLRKVLGWLARTGHADARRHLVLNRAGAGGSLELDDVTATVGLPIAVSIPNDVAVVQSVNDGRPLTETDSEERTAAAFAALVARFVPAREESRRSWMGWRT